MAEAPVDLTLEVAPRARFDVVELRSQLPTQYRDALAPYPHCLYWSAHTTAGFLDRSLIARLGPEGVPTYVDALRRIFPEGADYAHDRLERRLELDAARRAVEPRNGDSHLLFMAGGLRPCVTHPNRPGETVCFVELDGINDGRPRRRQTRVIGFRHEAMVAQTRLDVPVSRHPIESVNLKDPKLGIYEHLADFVARTGVGTGRLHLALDPGERHAALTVNEFETLLMQYDLAAVLRNPLRFVTRESWSVLANPRAVPGKALGYAQYDFVRVLNSGLDTLGLHGSMVEKVLARTLAVPAARFFRMRRSVHLLVAERDDRRHGFVEGQYQSPILVQWQHGHRATRTLHVTLTSLE
jgi:thiamine phosphate synthase YjbQ (UPF0047 family)